MVKICMTSKFCSGHAQGFLNLFTAGNVCFILLLRLTKLKERLMEISVLYN